MREDHSLKGIPPPVYLALAVALGVVLDILVPLPFLPSTFAFWLGVALGVVGVLLNWWAAFTMLRAHTSLTGLTGSTVVIQSGPFALSRNPIYLSMLLLAAAVALAVNSGWGLMLLVPLFLALYFFVVVSEEQYLESLFGDEYRNYCSRVPRWV